MKGQVSIDILLALIAAIIFFGVLMVHNSNVVQSTDDAALHNGLKAILMDAYAAVGTVKAEGVQVDYISPTLNLGEGGTPLNDCQITIDPTFIRVSAQGKNASYTNIGTGISPTATYNCGTKITLS